MPEFQLEDISLSVPSKDVGERVLRALAKGHFERDEARAMRAHFGPDDRLLDLGSGTGFIATIAGRIAAGEAVTGVEALPHMVDIAKANLVRNGVQGARILWGAVVPPSFEGAQVRYRARRQFWASSVLSTATEQRGRQMDVPALRLDTLLEMSRATVISCDIEGGELALFEAELPQKVRLIILEIHPGRYGDAGTARIFGALAQNNMVYCARRSVGATVVFRRIGTGT